MEQIFLEQGLLGAIIIALAGVCLLLFNRISALQEKLFEMNTTVVKALTESTATEDKMANAVATLADEIRRGGVK